MSEPDPRFLAGETAVLTDTRDMALCIAIGWDGAADISAHIAKDVAAKHLRFIADQWDADPALRALQSAVWRIVNEVDECNHVTTEGGDRFMLTDEEAEAVRAALKANTPPSPSISKDTEHEK